MKLSVLFIFLTIKIGVIISQDTSSGTAIYALYSNQNTSMMDNEYPEILKNLFKEMLTDKKQNLISVSFDSAMHESKGVDIAEEATYAETSFASISAMHDNMCYNARNQNILNPQSLDSLTYLVASKVEMSGWKFSDETENIKGYNSHKVVHKSISPIGKELITNVWYTTDIDSKVGPSKYVNFPGLVVKVESPLLIYELVHINHDDIQVTCSLPGTLVTESEFVETERAYFKKKREKLHFKN
jgi:GLPGLI family protein